MMPFGCQLATLMRQEQHVAMSPALLSRLPFNVLRATSVATSARQDPAQQPPEDCWHVAAGHWLAQAARGARATVAELLHLGRNPFMNAAVIATAPLVLLMHATMPALTDGATLLAHTASPSVKTAAALVAWAGIQQKS